MPPDPAGPVLVATTPVTILDVFTKQVEMGAQLLVIHEQLKVIPDHEARIRALERFRFTLMGATVVVSGAISAMGTWLISGIMHH